jgi:hypothetical protein
MNKKRRWECTAANREYSAIDEREMKLRLEELLKLLLNRKGQLTRQTNSVHVLSDERKTA